MSESADRLGEVRRLVSDYLPGYVISAVEYLGEGMDNTTFEVNGELVVRFAKDTDHGARDIQVSREAQLLTVVTSVATVPTPEPVFVAPHAGCLAYKKLHGSAVLDLPSSQRRVHAVSLAAELGMFLSSIHGIPIAEVDQFVDLDIAPLNEYLSEAAEFYGGLKDMFTVAQQRAVEVFLSAPLPDHVFTAVMCHNDLSIDHILVDPSTWRATAIIDWTDAAITDPAHDFALICRDLGPEALDAARDSYTSKENDGNEMRERAMFVARCKVFEDLHYGMDTEADSYTDNSMAAMEWLFP